MARKLRVSKLEHSRCGRKSYADLIEGMATSTSPIVGYWAKLCEC